MSRVALSMVLLALALDLSASITMKQAPTQLQIKPNKPKLGQKNHTNDEHPVFFGSTMKVNACNRQDYHRCNITVRDSSVVPECNSHFNEFLTKQSFEQVGNVFVVGNGAAQLEEMSASIPKAKAVTIEQAPLSSDALKSVTSKSKAVVYFNYHLHHAADDTIALLKEASRVASKYIMISEEIKTFIPDHWKLLFEDDTCGTYRGDEEWKMLFKLLDLKVVQEFDPSCMQAEHNVTRKLYVLKPSPLSHQEASGLHREPKLGVPKKFQEIWDCVNLDFLNWLKADTEQMEVMDVGGGHAHLNVALHKQKLADKIHYSCVDFNPTKECPPFNGRNLTLMNDTSYDAVMYHSTLHHAADTTLSLLLDAKRVTRKYVIVSEDLKAPRGERENGGELDLHAPRGTKRLEEYVLQWVQHKHDPHGTFRGDVEWKALFELTGLKLVHEAGPQYCGDTMDVGRKLYILQI